MKKLKKGSKGSDVKTLQTTLNKTPPKAKLKVDGDFGAKTEAAVKAFQKAKRLKQDGIVGEKTLSALGLSKRKDPALEWPWPDMDPTIDSNAKLHLETREIIDKALRIAGKIKTAEMIALEKKMLAELKNLTRQFLAHDKPARAVVVLERAFLKAKRDKPADCPGILKKAKKLAEASVKASIAWTHTTDRVHDLAAEIKKKAAENPPMPRPVEKTRKRISRYKQLRKADDESMKKSLELCRRHSSPGVDVVRDKFLELEKTANNPGNSSVPQIMRNLVELEVREIKYNKSIRSAPIEKVRRALHDIKVLDETIGGLEKARLLRLKKKAALDKELVKQVKASVFA
ncbi:MAG: peptidoglycan-binding protein [Paracoccaceae bacterium]